MAKKKKQTWPKSCCTCTKKHPQGLQRFLTEADLAQEEQEAQDTNK